MTSEPDWMNVCVGVAKQSTTTTTTTTAAAASDQQLQDFRSVILVELISFLDVDPGLRGPGLRGPGLRGPRSTWTRSTWTRSTWTPVYVDPVYVDPVYVDTDRKASRSRFQISLFFFAPDCKRTQTFDQCFQSFPTFSETPTETRRDMKAGERPWETSFCETLEWKSLTLFAAAQQSASIYFPSFISDRYSSPPWFFSLLISIRPLSHCVGQKCERWVVCHLHELKHLGADLKQRLHFTSAVTKH